MVRHQATVRCITLGMFITSSVNGPFISSLSTDVDEFVILLVMAYACWSIVGLQYDNSNICESPQKTW